MLPGSRVREEAVGSVERGSQVPGDVVPPAKPKYKTANACLVYTRHAYESTGMIRAASRNAVTWVYNSSFRTHCVHCYCLQDEIWKSGNFTTGIMGVLGFVCTVSILPTRVCMYSKHISHYDLLKYDLRALAYTRLQVMAYSSRRICMVPVYFVFTTHGSARSI